MPRIQPPTFLSVGDLGRACEFKMPQVGDRLSRLVASASSQGGASGKGKPALHIDDVGFLLVDMDQAARPDIHKSHKIGLVVSVLGVHSPTPEYPQGVQQVNCAIQWENGRNDQFDQCVPRIITALSQGKNVMVHCIQSYHRGPIGVAAICKALFGFNVRSVLKFIASRRDVHLAYGSNEKIGGVLGRAITWAEGLQLYKCPRPITAASSQGGAASSQGVSASSSGAPGLGVWDTPVLLTPRSAAKQLAKDKGRFLYRAMAKDGSDITDPHPASSQGLSGMPLGQAILRAVEKGSHEKSPFLHFSWSFIEARNWHMRGVITRGEKTGYMARVAVKDLEDMAAEELRRTASSQAKPGPVAVLGGMLDLSSGVSQRKALGPLAQDPQITDRVSVLGICVSHKEVLVPWRGCLPENLFERISSDTGLPVVGTYSKVYSNRKMGQESSRLANELRGQSVGDINRRSHASVNLFHVFSAHPFCSSSFRLQPCLALFQYIVHILPGCEPSGLREARSASSQGDRAGGAGQGPGVRRRGARRCSGERRSSQGESPRR